jgi:large subunit ribosomal protein L9
MHMKVILNKDLSTLGEEGDVKEVAKGYARNFLFPRGIALPYTARTVAMFEARKDEIEAHKAAKRQDAAGMKERLEALSINIPMQAGANGKLYGAVTGQTIVDELSKLGFDVEKRRIEVPGNTIKGAGNYKVAVKLYGNASAEVPVTVEAIMPKVEEKAPVEKKRRRRYGEEAEAAPENAAPADGEAAAENAPAESAETPDAEQQPAQENSSAELQA